MHLVADAREAEGDNQNLNPHENNTRGLGSNEETLMCPQVRLQQLQNSNSLGDKIHNTTLRTFEGELASLAVKFRAEDVEAVTSENVCQTSMSYTHLLFLYSVFYSLLRDTCHFFRNKILYIF